MKTLKSCKSSILIKTLIPSLVRLAFLTIEKAIRNGVSHTEGLESNYFYNEDVGNRPMWLLEAIYQGAKSLEEIIFGAYENYFTFLLMMLAVNAIFHGLDMIQWVIAKISHQRKTSELSSWKNTFLENHEALKQAFWSLLRYSLIFCFYQALWISIGSSVSLKALDQITFNNSPQNILMESGISNRILEEEEEETPKFLPIQKPSLSIGKILGQLDIFAVSIQLSRDEKTAFVTTNYPSTLKILDVSDPEFPVILSSINVPTSAFDLIFKSLLLSPDESKLYMSNIETLLMFDITILKSPFVIATIQDKAALVPTQDEKIYGIIKPNLLLSRDNKFLFVSGFGLQIFDVSVPTVPSLFKSFRSRINSEMSTSTSIALSADKKTLYYSDGGLSIFNVEDVKNMRVSSSFNTTYPITSMIISDDSKTAFILGFDGKHKVYLQTLDISDISSIKEGEMTRLNQFTTCQPIFLERTPKNLFLMIVFMDEIAGVWHKMLVFDTNEQRFISNKRFLVKDSLSLFFTQDYKKVFMGNSGKFEIANLFPEHPNKHAFTASNNIIPSFSNTTAGFQFFSLNFEETMYGVSKNSFGIHRMEFNGQLRNVSIYQSEEEEEIRNMVISKDYTRAFLIYQSHMRIMDIEKQENLTVLQDYIVHIEQGVPMISSLALSNDGKIGYLTFSCFGVNYLEVLDIENFNKTLRMNLGRLTPYMTPFLSIDENTLFLVSKNLLIFNVSDPWRPELLKTFSFLIEEDQYKSSYPFIASKLSPDGKSLIIKDESSLMHNVLFIVDVSDVSLPQIRGEFRFPLNLFDPAYAQKSILFSADSKTVYITRLYSLLVIDILNPSSPKYVGSIRVLTNNTVDRVRDFSLSKDGRKVYVLTKLEKLDIVGINPIYSTFIKQDTLMLGERYKQDLLVLEMNGFLDYNRMGAEYRFTRFSLVEPRSIQNVDFEIVTLKMAPSWMNFDLKDQTLTVEARRKNDLGIYKAYFEFSTQLSRNVFSTELSPESLAKTEGPVKPQDIFPTLIALDYVDNQLFLTGNFGEFDDFILPSQYEPIEYEIYEILKRYSFGTYNEIKIIESLSVENTADDELQISTASVSNLKVEISLAGEAQFLHRYYGFLMPLITNNKSRLVVEGSLKDINLALKEVVVNLPEKIPCDGEIIIDDKLNPVRTKYLKNISRLFNHNEPPGLSNKSNVITIQNQVDKEDVSTGQYFQIKLSAYTFFDQYTEVENLNYQLVYMKYNNESHILPSWLSFSDLTLMGTAPEELFERNFEFKLIVKNEFQEFKVPLKLHVSISSGFVFKLFLKYSPYILSIVGLLISANKIFNVVFKGSYRHMKEFYVNAGEKVTSEVIFPVGFIREEIQEASKIMKLLKLGKKKLLSSSSSNFIQEGRLDKLKVIETINDSLNQLSFKEKKKNFDLYLGGSHPARIINQIIINKLTNEMLDEDKETKKCFEEIKKNWPDVVEWDLINSCFKINDENLRLALRKIGRTPSLDATIDDKESLMMSSSLIEKSNLNIELLRDSILAYAFDCQNIDVLPVSVEFHVKERIKANFLKQFLKLDLKGCPFREKGKIGYGIEYFKEYQTLYFRGIVTADMRNKTLVVQITNLQQKILKEIWIFGSEGNYSENEGVVMDKREIDAKGKEYEVF